MKLVPGRLLVTKRYVKQKCQRNAQTNNNYKLHIFKLLFLFILNQLFTLSTEKYLDHVSYHQIALRLMILK